MQRYAKEEGVEFACPALPPLADDAIREIEKLPMRNVCLIGSSLGGFYATYLAEKHGLKAVLINPAIDPHVGLRAYLGPQKNLHTGQPYELTEAHLAQWKKLYMPRVTPRRYLLLVETGDEVLDYRQAVARYAGAELREGDRVVILSNGGFGGIHEKLLRALQGEAPPPA